MNLRWCASALLSLAVLAVGCKDLETSRLGPSPPGWRSPVAELLLDETDLPEGWQGDLEFPEGRITDPTINHAAQEWWNPEKGSAGIMQSIWRAYTIEDAQEKYAELRQSPVLLSRFTPSPYDYYVEFHPPSEISFQSQIADEFYIACGWIVWPYCEVVVRYRNYVVDMRLDLETEDEGRATHGLTYEEIETAIEAMDAKFAEALEEFYPSSP
jgi:hypothetical protein